jgi:diguanylate cyclase (GGDEF)-like protein
MSMRVLIADDDATSRLLLHAMATKLGHECVVATDGSSAWEQLSSRAFDVLLTDWMMPGLNGADLCRRVRDEQPASYLYIVLVTGLGNPEQVLEGMNAGADDYLIKPVDPFAVQTRLVAAARVTALHRQVADFRSELERVNRVLLGHSLTDPLTGLGNRRQMEQDLADAEARARRAGQPYAIALFDIDHFKLYNDHYGHLAGDDALREVARCLIRNARADETVYRFGGEEFLLLIPGGDEAGALTAARRMCQAVAELGIPHDARPTPPALVTVSGGVASSQTRTAGSLSELLHHADRALFEAKSAGRNGVRDAPVDPEAATNHNPPPMRAASTLATARHSHRNQPARPSSLSHPRDPRPPLIAS